MLFSLLCSSIIKENLEPHIKRCPFAKRTQALESQPYYSKGLNGGGGGGIAGSFDDDDDVVTSEAKRKAIHSLTVPQFRDLVAKIKLVRSSISLHLPDSYVVSDPCEKWLKRQVDRQLPYQEKHVKQQVSILGNMEAAGILRRKQPEEEAKMDSGCGDRMGSDVEVPAVLEFGAGRGYLTHMLVDCYGIRKVVLVERRSYKFKADRNLRQVRELSLDRVRIDIEDLNLHAIESLRGLAYLAIGKHLCGPATDLAIRCCLPEEFNGNKKLGYLQGLALATCCHHLCQWKHYPNKSFLLKLGITKGDFNAITWFSSWAVDANHSSDASNVVDQGIQLNTIIATVEEAIRKMQAAERAVLGFMCKEIVDIGRMLWLREHGLDVQLVKYVPSSISPENHLLLAACCL